jgi:hypothetical protein
MSGSVAVGFACTASREISHFAQCSQENAGCEISMGSGSSLSLLLVGHSVREAGSIHNQ